MSLEAALLAVAAGAYGLGAAGALAGRGSRWLATAGALAGAGAGLALGGLGLLRDTPLTIRAPLLPLTGLALRLDGLAGFFLVVIGVVAVAAVVYGHGYTAGRPAGPALRALGALLNALLAVLTLQVLADNALTFLLAWEAMSLVAALLVLTEHDHPASVRAGYWYLAVTHAGFAALVAMFFLLSAGDLTLAFDGMRAARLSPGVRDAAFLLALVGFGAKAGLVPLHVWLPMAHPVAPSHVSALLSGVVIKMGVYGVLRVVVDLLGGGPAWWGGLLLALGAASAVLGVLYALMEHDLKRLLAYHSVENVGIIFIGLGAGLLLQSYGLAAPASLGLAAGLYHTLNHACFKGLLFLGAGAVLRATSTRNMEALGGLVGRMPVTAACFLVGAAAIAALPPLNGFASEWLVFQTLLGGAAIPAPEVAALMPVAVAMLALTGGLAAACFVKAFGITFLARPRSPAAAAAGEAPRSMQAGMVALALACGALGLGALLVVPVLGRVVAGLGSVPRPAPLRFTLDLPLRPPGAAGEMSPLLVAAGLGLILALTALLLRAGADRRLRVSDTWGCGRIGQTARMEYTATAFAEPLRRVFAELYRPTQDLSITVHPESRYFVRSIAYRAEVHPWFERLLYEPLVRLVRRAARRVRALQAGSLHLYLGYITAALVALLVAARWLR